MPPGDSASDARGPAGAPSSAPSRLEPAPHGSNSSVLFVGGVEVACYNPGAFSRLRAHFGVVRDDFVAVADEDADDANTATESLKLSKDRGHGSDELGVSCFEFELLSHAPHTFRRLRLACAIDDRAYQQSLCGERLAGGSAGDSKC